MFRTAAVALAFAVLFCVANARGAGKPRIAVLQPDDELLRAISIALSPWSVDTTSSDLAVPGSSQPAAVQTASRLAEQLGVDALVWLTPTEQGSLLWVFDNRGDVTTRALPQAPPFDSAAAAAVALSVKTILRSSVVAPQDERSEAPASSERAEHTAAMEIGTGVRWLDERELEFRIELAAVLWLQKARRVGTSLELSWGPGVQIDDSSYRGRYREFAAGAKARARVLDFKRLSVIVSLGAAARWATLEGTANASAGPSASSVKRLNASIDLQTSLNLRLTKSTYLGASLAASYLPAYQRYLVEGRPIFSPWPVTASLTGYCGVDLF
jgi:hypothetical protein